MSHRREFFLSNREAGKPGMYSVAELAEAGAAQHVADMEHRRQDAFSRSVRSMARMGA